MVLGVPPAPTATSPLLHSLLQSPGGGLQERFCRLAGTGGFSGFLLPFGPHLSPQAQMARPELKGRNLSRRVSVLATHRLTPSIYLQVRARVWTPPAPNPTPSSLSCMCTCACPPPPALGYSAHPLQQSAESIQACLFWHRRRSHTLLTAGPQGRHSFAPN